MVNTGTIQQIRRIKPLSVRDMNNVKEGDLVKLTINGGFNRILSKYLVFRGYDGIKDKFVSQAENPEDEDTPEVFMITTIRAAQKYSSKTGVVLVTGQYEADNLHPSHPEYNSSVSALIKAGMWEQKDFI